MSIDERRDGVERRRGVEKDPRPLLVSLRVAEVFRASPSLLEVAIEETPGVGREWLHEGSLLVKQDLLFREERRRADRRSSSYRIGNVPRETLGGKGA